MDLRNFEPKETKGKKLAIFELAAKSMPLKLKLTIGILFLYLLVSILLDILNVLTEIWKVI